MDTLSDRGRMTIFTLRWHYDSYLICRVILVVVEISAPPSTNIGMTPVACRPWKCKIECLSMFYFIELLYDFHFVTKVWEKD